MELYRASKQWATRPDDERFLTLDELHEATFNRAKLCDVEVMPVKDFSLEPQDYDTDIAVIAPDGEHVRPTNWSFGQMCSTAKVPAKWARENTHPTIAALALEFGLAAKADRSHYQVMRYRPDVEREPTMLALTGENYGRIYDYEVVESVIRATEGMPWQVPASSFEQNDRSATTLYASDRDVFIFLVDPENAIEINGDKLYKGFFCWNSEVGSTTFGIETFLYRYVCGNRIVWGAQLLSSLRIRHSSGAPARFEHEGAKMLERYASVSTKAIEDRVSRSMDMEVGKNDDEVTDWLRRRNFTVKKAREVIEMARREEGDARTVWQLVNGGTYAAKGIAHTDERLAAERQASSLLNAVKAA